MKKIKIRKLFIKLPRKVQTKRFASLGIAFVMLFSTLSYNLFIKNSSKVKAATVGNSSVNTGSGTPAQRHVVVTSDGKMVVVYNAGSQSPNGLSYSVSTDNGANWNSGIQIDSTNTSDFSIAIDGSDHIYIAFTSGGIKVRKLTYSGGSWSVGSSVTVEADSTCDFVSTDGAYSYYPTIAITSSNKYFVNYMYQSEYYGAGCGADPLARRNSSSTNFTSWTLNNSAGASDSSAIPIAVVGKSQWTVINGYLSSDLTESGSWNGVPGVASIGTSSNGTTSISSGLDAIHILYETATQVEYRKYDLATATLSAATVISTGTNDYTGAIISDSINLWAVYGSYIASNSYNVVYKRFNGSSWDGSSTSITTDNLNNRSIGAAERMPNTANVPVAWTSGTSSPYTVKAGSFTTVSGTITDTGTQTGTYSGTLTGSSGDTLVKCGTWYYNTVNIVAGMNIKVCSSNGVAGGQLTIYANSVTIAGTIDGAGRGMPGGVSFRGVGGNGGSERIGLSSYAGITYAGGAGAGAYGSNGGSAGTSGSAGASGASNTGDGGSGGGGGGNGGNASTIAGYLAAGTNGDSSTDESLTFGSGGGAGGSGSGGGGGGSGAQGTPPAIGFGGCGGAGGSGGAGGYGGKGGNGGALIKIIAAGNVTVSGSILATGSSGTSGIAGGTGTNGDYGEAESSQPDCGGV
jgi:hypothetical protein